MRIWDFKYRRMQIRTFLAGLETLLSDRGAGEVGIQVASGGGNHVGCGDGDDGR